MLVRLRSIMFGDFSLGYLSLVSFLGELGYIFK